MKHFCKTLLLVGLMLLPCALVAQGRDSEHYRNAEAAVYSTLATVADSASTVHVADSLEQAAAHESDSVMQRWDLFFSNLLYLEYQRATRDRCEIDLELFEKARQLSPSREGFYSGTLAMVQNMAARGMKKEAELKIDSLFQIAKAENNDYGLYVSYMCTGMLHKNLMDKSLALEAFERAAEIIKGNPDYITEFEECCALIEEIYSGRKDWAKCEEVLAEMFKAMPEDNWIALAKQFELYLNQDKLEKAHSLYTEQLVPNVEKMYHQVQFLVYNLYYVLDQFAIGNTELAIQLLDSIPASGYEERMIHKILLCQLAGKWEEACGMYSDLISFNDSVSFVRNVEQLNKVYGEMAVLYETHEKEKEIMRQRYYLIGAIAFIIFLAILALVVIKRNRDVAAKNRSLVANINELLDAHQKELAMMKYVVAPVENLASDIAEKKEPEEPENEAEAASRRVQYYIYQLTSRKLFCSADFDRDALLEELHLQKNGFWKDFVEVTGQNFSNYLLNLRLEYAAEQIRRHPEYTVDAIATESGFSGRSTFYRNFSSRFGITPTLFREQSITA